MKTAKVLRVKTEAAAHVVIRNRAGKKLFDLDLSGVSVTVAIPSNAEIKIELKQESKGRYNAADDRTFGIDFSLESFSAIRQRTVENLLALAELFLGWLFPVARLSPLQPSDLTETLKWHSRMTRNDNPPPARSSARVIEPRALLDGVKFSAFMSRARDAWLKQNAENLTTEQLATKVLGDVKQMSPKEKAEARKHLEVSKWCTNCRAIISLDNHGRCGNCDSNALVVEAPPPGFMLVQASDGGLHHIPNANTDRAKAIDPKLTILYVEPSLTEPPFDPVTQVTEEMNQRLAQLPRAVRYVLSHAETESMTAGDCGEPNYTTPSGIPICSKCGKSTRNTNELVCAPCRKQTRLMLTDADKKLLRQIGIAR